MGTSLVIFRFRGIDVRVHWSFLLILAWGAFIYRDGSAGPVAGAIYGIFVTVLLFVCVTLHEFGHALTAQYFNIKVSNITLLPIGGVANLERMPDKPMQEFLITLAGPAVNFVIALLLLPFVLFFVGSEIGNVPLDLSIFPRILQIFGRALQRPGLTNLFTYLFVTNIFLGLFNLLPAFPMDGGRILRALLAMTMSYVRATRLAVLVGRIIAVILALMGLFTFNIWMLLIAFFVYVGGGAEREAVESKAVLRYFNANQALTHSAVNLYSSEQLSRAVDLIMSTYQSDYPVFDLNSKFVGVLTRPILIQALQTVGPEGRIVDVMLPADQVAMVTPSTNLAEVWELMATSGARVVGVKNGAEFLGLLTLEDINEVFQVMGASMSRTGKPTPPDNLSNTPTKQPSEHTIADA